MSQMEWAGHMVREERSPKTAETKKQGARRKTRKTTTKTGGLSGVRPKKGCGRRKVETNANNMER